MSVLPLTALLSVVERLPSAIVLTDPSGHVVAASPLATTLIGPTAPGASVPLDRRLADARSPLERASTTQVESDGITYDVVALASEHLSAADATHLASVAGEILHEFNNLIGVIINFTTLAMADLPTGSQTVRDLQEVLSASRRAAGLSQQLTQIGGPATASSSDAP